MTFASIIQQELVENSGKVELSAIITATFERRLYTFTMSKRCVRTVNLADMYQMVHFVGLGVLNGGAEAVKRTTLSHSPITGCANPEDIDELDPQGNLVLALSGHRRTVKGFFRGFLRNLPLHGGNLLQDSRGFVWLIDFTTAQDSVHVLINHTKFMATPLFIYLGQSADEQHVQTFAQLLATAPHATTALPLAIGENLRQGVTANAFKLLSRLLQCMFIYEIGDDAPFSDGVPCSIAFSSWSVRMLSYAEPSFHQKMRGLYFSIAGVQRLLREPGLEMGPTNSGLFGRARKVVRV